MLDRKTPFQCIIEAQPQPTAKTLSVPPVNVSVIPSAPRTNRRVSRLSAQAKIEEEVKKMDILAETEPDSISAIYENENVYDIIDDPDIQAKSPATITRI
jgi:hypothetical protein